MENSKNKEETKMSEVLNVEEIFGSKVFTLGKMRERLPKSCLLYTSDAADD